MNEKILFITLNDIINFKSGGEYISKRNYMLLSKVLNVDLVIFNKKDYTNYSKLTIPKAKNKLETFMFMLTNRFGYNYKNEKKIIDLIYRENYKYIFLDSSLLGELCEKIRKKFPNIKIITFFHNIEYNFINERAKVTNKIYYLMSFFAYMNEKKSIKYSDKVIVLNLREKEEMKKIYKKNAEYVLPLTFEDKFDEKMIIKHKEINYLFVGSYFYANYEGVLWFILKVLPNVNGTLYIVGKDFEKIKDKLEKYERVKVIGTVKSTSDWYYSIPIVVSPIFSGAGMKTKTAEALMYGKYIFGTTEAFEGYDLDYSKIGGLCNTAAEFINSINVYTNYLENEEKPIFNKYSYQIFKEKYSHEVSLKKIKEIYEELKREEEI